MNGRIEIMLGGQLRTLRFNNYAKEQLGKIFGSDPLEAVQTLLDKLKESPVKAMVDLTYAGLIGAYEAREIPIDFVRADVAEWVGDADDTDMASVFNAWLDSSRLRSILPEQPDNNDDGNQGEAPKKKHPGKMSKTSQ